MKGRALQLCWLATIGTQEPVPISRRPPAIPELRSPTRSLSRPSFLHIIISYKPSFVTVFCCKYIFLYLFAFFVGNVLYLCSQQTNGHKKTRIHHQHLISGRGTTGTAMQRYEDLWN